MSISDLGHNLYETLDILLIVLIVCPLVLSLLLSCKPGDFTSGQKWISRYLRSIGISYKVVSGGGAEERSLYGSVIIGLLRIVGMIFLGYIVWVIIYSIPGQ